MKIGYLSAVITLPTPRRAPGDLRAQTAGEAHAFPGMLGARTLDLARMMSKGYSDYRVRHATAALLHALDDRALADIGINRGAIDSAVLELVPYDTFKTSRRS